MRSRQGPSLAVRPCSAGAGGRRSAIQAASEIIKADMNSLIMADIARANAALARAPDS